MASYGTRHSFPRYTVWCPKDRRRSWIKRCRGDMTRMTGHGGFKDIELRSPEVFWKRCCWFFEESLRGWICRTRTLLFSDPSAILQGFVWYFVVSQGIPTYQWPFSYRIFIGNHPIRLPWERSDGSLGDLQCGGLGLLGPTFFGRGDHWKEGQPEPMAGVVSWCCWCWALQMSAAMCPYGVPQVLVFHLEDNKDRFQGSPT